MKVEAWRRFNAFLFLGILVMGGAGLGASFGEPGSSGEPDPLAPALPIDSDDDSQDDASDAEPSDAEPEPEPDGSSLIGNRTDLSRHQGRRPLELRKWTRAERRSAGGLIAVETLERYLKGLPDLDHIDELKTTALSQRLWTARGGMRLRSARKLLDQLGVETDKATFHLGAGDDMRQLEGVLTAALRGGKPPILVASHFYVLQGYSNGKFLVGHTGRAMRKYGGRRWMTLEDIARAAVAHPGGRNVIGGVLIPKNPVPSLPAPENPPEEGGDDIGSIPDPTDAEPPPDCAAIDSSLKDALNVVVSGSVSCPRKQLIFTTVSIAFSDPEFKRRMQGNPIEFKNVAVDARWWGYVTNKNTIKLNKYDSRGSNGAWRYILIHELFHIFGARNRAVVGEYPYSELVSSDRGCFRDTPGGKVIRTYQLTPGRAKSESFAESGALSIFNHSTLQRGISDFRQDCANSYDWFSTRVFD